MSAAEILKAGGVDVPGEVEIWTQYGGERPTWYVPPEYQHVVRVADAALDALARMVVEQRRQAELAMAIKRGYRVAVEIARVRLNLAEQYIAELDDTVHEAGYDLATAEQRIAELDAEHKRVEARIVQLRKNNLHEYKRANKAEAYLAAERQKRIDDGLSLSAQLHDAVLAKMQSESDLAAERAKRCATCGQDCCYIGDKASELDGFERSTYRCDEWMARDDG